MTHATWNQSEFVILLEMIHLTFHFSFPLKIFSNNYSLFRLHHIANTIHMTSRIWHFTSQSCNKCIFRVKWAKRACMIRWQFRLVRLSCAMGHKVHISKQKFAPKPNSLLSVALMKETLSVCKYNKQKNNFHAQCSLL